jgi:hypothetical protein
MGSVEHSSEDSAICLILAGNFSSVTYGANASVRGSLTDKIRKHFYYFYVIELKLGVYPLAVVLQ